MWCLLHFVCRACGTRATFKVRGSIVGTEVQIEGTDVVRQWQDSHLLPEPFGAEINVG